MYRFILRDAAWLTTGRVLATSRVLLVFWLVLTASIPWTIPTMQVARDFAAFWTAAVLAVDGRAAAAYGDSGREAMAALFGPGTYAPFFYPPPALLIWFPFAFVPFTVAAALWVGGTAAVYAVAIRAVLKIGFVIPTLAFPAVVVCALYGQNALLSAALFGGAAATLDRYPALAGVFIGCFAYKPQLALLAPIALASAGRWRVFMAAAVTMGLLVALSTVAFGAKTWAAFIASLPDAAAWNAERISIFGKFASPFTAALLFGASENAAWVVQGVTAAVAIVALVAVTRRRPGGAAEMAMMVTATGFTVPFLGQYDVVIFAVAGAWLVSEARQTGWLAYERATLALLYIAPIAIAAAMVHGIPIAPVALVMLAILVTRRLFYVPLAPQ